MKALVVYYSKTGHTKQAGEDIARGLEDKGVETSVKAAQDTSGKDVKGYDILVVGTPTYGNRMYKRPAGKIEQFIASIPIDALKGKTAGAFTVNAAVGGAKVVAATERLLMAFGAKVVKEGPVVKAGAPLSMWKGPNASDADVKVCEDFGRKLAEEAG